MPKTPNRAKSALHITRNILKNKNKVQSASESTTDSDNDSIESAEFAHVPLKDLHISLDQINMAMENPLDQIAAQLNTMMQAINRLDAKQNEYDALIRNATSAPPAPPLPSTESPTGQQTRTNLDYLFKIPDPIKSLPVFEGNRKQLTAWLQTAENTLNFLKPHVNDTLFKMYVTAVTNKIAGKAKDILCLAGNPDDFDVIKDILTNALGDRQELSTYKCQLWQNKMSEGISIQKYHQKTKDIIQSIKNLAKQKQLYKDNWQAINAFIDEDGLAAFIAGLKEPYFGYAQAARPTDIEDAYAFLCKFKSKELTASYMSETPKHPKHFKQNSRFEKPHSHNNITEEKTDYKNNQKPTTSSTPMETESTKSRLTLNRRLINNHELDSSESEDEAPEEISVNFQVHAESKNET